MTHKERIWGARCGHASEIVEKVVQYLKEHPANYQGQVDTLLELLYLNSGNRWIPWMRR